MHLTVDDVPPLDHMLDGIDPTEDHGNHGDWMDTPVDDNEDPVDELPELLQDDQIDLYALDPYIGHPYDDDHIALDERWDRAPGDQHDTGVGTAIDATVQPVQPMTRIVHTLMVDARPTDEVIDSTPVYRPTQFGWMERLGYPGYHELVRGRLSIEAMTTLSLLGSPESSDQ